MKKYFLFLLISICLFFTSCGDNKETKNSEKNTAKEVQMAINQGNVFLEGENYDAAVTSFKRAIELDPDYADVYLILADIYENSEDYSLEDIKALLDEGSVNTGDERIVDRLALVNVLIKEENELKLLEEEKAREEEFRISEDLGSVSFGKYEEDNNIDNGKESINWLILYKEGSKALVVSEKILDCKPYNEGFKACTWESSSIRKWLNSDFYDAAFTESEKARILDTLVTPSCNVDYEVDAGNETTDKIFLLSFEEVEEYCTNTGEYSVKEELRIAKATQYAKAQGLYVMSEYLNETYSKGEDESQAVLEEKESDEENESGFETGAGWWWLRSLGAKDTKAMDVRTDGEIRYYGHLNGEGNIGVRPAMWISLE